MFIQFNSKSTDKKRQTIDNKDIRPFQGRGTVARQRNGGGFYSPIFFLPFFSCFPFYFSTDFPALYA